MCSPLVFPTPGLYPARSHATLGFRPVLRPVGRLPRHPFGKIPPSSAPAGLPSISSPMVGRGGQYGSLQVICETWCILEPVLARCIPLILRRTVPPLLPLFLPWLPFLSTASLFTRALCVPCAPLRVSPAPPPCAPTSCHAIAPSDGPVCTISSAVSAVVVLSPLCATRVFCPCRSLLSLPLSLVSCDTLNMPTLLCCCPLSLCFAFVPRLSPLPGRHGFMARGGGLLADWIVALLVDGLDDGLLGSDDRDFPHAAGTNEPPWGPQ